ncbi:MAG: FkbM family methyltransferase [Pirellulaceae bacterium]
MCNGIRETEISLRNGLRLSCDVQDYNGRMLYFWGTADPKIVALCRKHLNHGDLFLDIGANYGSIGLQCLDAVGSRGKVLFYEPNISLCKAVSKCIEENRIANAYVHCCGLWDSSGSMQLSLNTLHSGAAHLVECDSNLNSLVEVRDIKKELKEQIGTNSFGTKIDVEGAEHRLLPSIVSHTGFRFAIVESHSNATRNCVLQLKNQLDLMVFGISTSPLRVKTIPIINPSDIDAYHDLLITRPT